MAERRSEIIYKEVTDGNVEICKELCNALMTYKADNGVIHPEVLRAMNFDNRLKPSFEGSAEKQLIVAFDGTKPVGYVFSSVSMETESSKRARKGYRESMKRVFTLIGCLCLRRSAV